jgi:hypothetical protein
MLWFFIIPSNDAIKHWDIVQRTMIVPPCTADDLDAAYFSAFDRLGAYYNLLFGLPAVCGAFGLLLLGWRWPIQLWRQGAHEALCQRSRVLFNHRGPVIGAYAPTL